jgi:hypothetical protein
MIHAIAASYTSCRPPANQWRAVGKIELTMVGYRSLKARPSDAPPWEGK